MTDALTAETIELLQHMIRNRCVNDGTAESGYETRNADLLRSFLGSTGLDCSSTSRTPGPRLAGRRASRAATRRRRACA